MELLKDKLFWTAVVCLMLILMQLGAASRQDVPYKLRMFHVGICYTLGIIIVIAFYGLLR